VGLILVAVSSRFAGRGILLYAPARDCDLRLAVTGMLAAISFAVFHINIQFAGGVHVKLTPLVGILAGLGIGSLVIFIVNLLSAAAGNGRWDFVALTPS
jgi:ABC-type Co2+ transport system permease subunit